MRRRVIIAGAAALLLAGLLLSCAVRLLAFRQVGWAVEIDLARGAATRVPAVGVVRAIGAAWHAPLVWLAWPAIEVEDLARGRQLPPGDPTLDRVRATIAARGGARTYRRAIWWIDEGTLELDADGGEPEAILPFASPAP